MFNSDITVVVISQVDHWQAQELGVETCTMCSSMQHGDMNWKINVWDWIHVLV